MRRIGAILSFVLAAVLIIVGIVYFFTGSLEMNPTQEQMESARIGAFFVIMMGIVSGVLGILLGKRNIK